MKLGTTGTGEGFPPFSSCTAITPTHCITDFGTFASATIYTASVDASCEPSTVRTITVNPTNIDRAAVWPRYTLAAACHAKALSIRGNRQHHGEEHNRQ